MKPKRVDPLRGEMDYYDKEGNLIDLWAWSQLFETPGYRGVAETTLPDGKWVSTVWLGLDHRFMEEGPPLFFETMVFASWDNLEVIDTRRYSTLAEAELGHTQMILRFSERATAEQD